MTRKTFVVVVAVAMLSGCVDQPARVNLWPLPLNDPGQGEPVVVITEGACANAVRVGAIVGVGLGVGLGVGIVAVAWPLLLVNPQIIAKAASEARGPGYPPADGHAVSSHINRACYVGQLIAVGEQSLVVLREPEKPVPADPEPKPDAPARLYEIGLAQITMVEVPMYYAPFREFTDENLQRLRAYAAYPGGLSPGQRRALLEQYGQKDFLKVSSSAASDEKLE